MENNDVIEVKINLSAKDRERAMFYNYFVRRKLVLFEVIFVSLLGLTGIVLKLSGIWADMSKGLFIVCCAVILMVAIFMLFLKYVASLGGLGQTRYITITPEALTTRVSGEKKEFTIKWQDFAKIAKTKYNYILYPDLSQYLVLPRRFFTKEEQDKINSYLR